MRCFIFLCFLVHFIDCQAPWTPWYSNVLRKRPRGPSRRPRVESNVFCGYNYEKQKDEINESYKNKEAPWMAAVYVFKNKTDLLRKTTGALINDRYVLVTATSLDSGNCFGVVLGLLTGKKEFHSENTAKFHSDFNSMDPSNNNVALIKMEQPTSITSFLPFSPPENLCKSIIGETAQFYAYNGKGNYSQMNAVIHEYSKCDNKCNPNYPLTSKVHTAFTHFCIEVPEKEHLKLYGFVVLDGELIGLAFCYTSSLALTVRVDRHVPWIEKEMERP